MKAWQVMSDPDSGSTVVFAETRGQAKQLAMSTDTCKKYGQKVTYTKGGEAID